MGEIIFDDGQAKVVVVQKQGIPGEGNTTATDNHIADSSDAHDASAISIADAGGHYTGTEVEAALQELGVPLKTPSLSGYFIGPTSSETVAVTSGWAYGAAMWNPTEFTTDALQFEVATGVADSTFRPIIWRGDLTEFLVDGGAQSAATSGVQTVVLGSSVVIPRGWTWWGGVPVDGGSGTPQLRGIASNTANVGLRLQDDNQGGAWPGAIFTAGAAEPQSWNGQGRLIAIRARLA